MSAGNTDGHGARGSLQTAKPLHHRAVPHRPEEHTACHPPFSSTDSSDSILTALRFYMPRVVCRRMSATCMASASHLPHDRSLASQQQLHAWPGARNYISVQQSNLTKLMQDFGEVANIPNVVGCVNGTQIPVLAPHHNEHLYICRKRFHAMNVQVVCDSQLRFTKIAAKWPGSTHDSFMGQNSALYHRMRSM